jgi:hypothetical protein
MAQSPPTHWENYGACARCKSPAGGRCRTPGALVEVIRREERITKGRFLARPHPGRRVDFTRRKPGTAVAVGGTGVARGFRGPHIDGGE